MVNLSHVVPVVPPSTIVGYQYSLLQMGEVGNNHSLLANDIPAVTSRVETNAPRTCPNSGLPG